MRELGDAATAQLVDHIRAAEDWPADRRIRELRDPSVCHEWLQALNPVHGPTLPNDDYMDAVRIRLRAKAARTAW